MRAVAACAQLRVLSVTGNPFSSARAHHVQLTDLIPSLELIDSRRVQTLRCRSGCLASSGSLTSTSHVKALRCPPRASSKSGSVVSRSAIMDQSRSIGDTSVSYGLLSQKSPARRPAQRRKSPHYCSPTKSYIAQRAVSPSPKPSRSLVNSRHKQNGQLAKSLGPSLSMLALGAGLGSTVKSPPASPSRPWVVASVLFSPNARARSKSPATDQDRQADGRLENEDRHADYRLQNHDRSAVTGNGKQKEIERLTLQELLEAKHRLLNKVSEKLSGRPGASCQGSQNAEHSMYFESERGAPPDAVLPTAEDARASTHHVYPASVENPAVPMVPVLGTDLASLRANLRTESLRSTLRDVIDRKRALLEQLRHV